jgi:DNA polymerase-2
MVYRGLEIARSDWTLLARQFQEGLLSRIFHGEPYRDFVAYYARSMLEGQMDALLVYRKRLRHRLDAYEVNVPPQVRAARIADAHNAKLNRPQQYQRGGWIEYVMTQSGPEPLGAVENQIQQIRAMVQYANEHSMGTDRRAMGQDGTSLPWQAK